MGEGYDVFLSYTHSDRVQVLALRDALEAGGLRVWLDDATIDTFESISGAIERGLARSKALVAFYSESYPTRRACQWELTAAFLAAGRLGDPRRRVLVVNPEVSAGHIEPVELRDALFVGGADEVDAADKVIAHVAGLEGELGDLGVSVRPSWFGQRPIGSARFVGRVVDMWKVHSALHACDVALVSGARGGALAQVTGMGGIGKSLLAAEYALRFGAAYPGGIFWLLAFGDDDASEPLTAEGRVAQRDGQLLGFARDLGLDVSDVSPDELSGALARALDDRAQPFLWIVDDLPGELGRGELDGWLAPGRLGRTLLTSRSRDYAAVGSQIDLGMLNQDEGVELLSRHRQPDGAQELQAARALVVDLGGHALALDVAGAALKAERGVRTFAQYRAALATASADELELAAGYAGELPTGHEASIASTLARSIARLDDAGLDFLRLASVLAVQPIAANLVIDVFAHADALGPDTARTQALSAMHTAAALSLTETLDQGDGSRQVHTLVSRTIRLLERNTKRSTVLADAAIKTLTVELSASSSTQIPAGDSALAHARHLASAASEPEQVALLAEVSSNDTYRGDYRSARALDEQVLEVQRRVLGDEHPHTVTSMSNLALTLGRLGDLEAARALLERVVDTRRRALGDQHPDTLASMGNLAVTLGGLDDLEGSRTLHERVLEARRRVLGDEHPGTLASMNNLAVTLYELGDLEGARALDERVLEARRRVFGDEHPDTLTSTGNLAATLSAMGDLEGARALHERVLDVWRRVLGDEHPHTLLSMSNLAVTLYALGDLRDARALHERVLEARRRVLGDQHPDTLASISNLTDMRGSGGLRDRIAWTAKRRLATRNRTR